MSLLLLMTLSAGSADDWTGFRGTAGNGLSTESKAPSEWGPAKNVVWKVALPLPCNGSPIVCAGRVFLVGPEDAEGRRRSLYCFDRKNGKQLWVRTVDVASKLPTHETNPYCGSTPAADGRRVVVFHGAGGLRAYDLEGKELWTRDLGEFKHMWGDGTSPVLRGDRVFLHAGPGKRVFVTALDAGAGKTVWETEEPLQGNGDFREPKVPMGSWSTPAFATVAGKEQLITVQPTRVVGYDPVDGKILWWCDGVRHKKGDLAYSSPVISGDVCFVTGGYGGPAFSVRLGGSGDVTATHRLWRAEGQPQSIGTGVAIDGAIYRPNAGANSIECLDPATGKAKWTEKSPAGAFWGSIISAAGRLYVTGQDGSTVVFKPNPAKFELVAVNKLGEPSNATPAASDGELFIRTFHHLYCLGP